MRRIIPYFIAILCLIYSPISNARDYLSMEEALKRFFFCSEKIEAKEVMLSEDKKRAIEKRLVDRIIKNGFIFYVGKPGGKMDGYGIEVTEQGKHGPIYFLIALTKEGHIRDIVILKRMEVKGAKIAKKRFLRQFRGKGLKNPLRLKKDIDAVTGATISSKAATKAARKALFLWQDFLSLQ